MMVRWFLNFLWFCALATAACAQDRHDWQSLAQLHAGDRILLSLKTGAVKGAFQAWTPEEVTADTLMARKEDVLKVERYREGGWGRGTHALIGALVGFGGGFAAGAAAGGCRPNELLCLGRGTVGAVFGGVGALAGAGIGALVPPHKKDVIYSAR